MMNESMMFKVLLEGSVEAAFYDRQWAWVFADLLSGANPGKKVRIIKPSVECDECS